MGIQSIDIPFHVSIPIHTNIHKRFPFIQEPPKKKLTSGRGVKLERFHNLFISHLEDIFSKSHEEEVRNYMVNELKGKSEFLTKCRNCGNISSNQCSYNEIQLSLNKRTLDYGLRELLKSEDLSGANKYMCDRCNQLSDATREFKFSKLPKVLKFQLLRFAYDPYTGNRKKISSQFSFPMILDMNQLLDSSMYFFSFLFLLSAFCFPSLLLLFFQSSLFLSFSAFPLFFSFLFLFLLPFPFLSPFRSTRSPS